MKHSIKPYSKDISEVQSAFYKSTKEYLIQAWCIKEKWKLNAKDTSKICTYHMNETNPKTYRYLLKKEGMPSGASPSIDAWVSLDIYLGFLGHPQAWALASPPSPHTGTSSIFEHFIHTKLNRTFSGGVSEYGKEIPSCTAVILLYNYKQTLPTVCYHNSMAPSQGGFNKNSNIRK